MVKPSLILALALVSLAAPPAMAQTPYYSGAPQGPLNLNRAVTESRVLSDQDLYLFRQGLAAARARDVSGARSAQQQLSDPAARKLVEWALLDTSAAQLGATELVAADAVFAGWPRGDSRRQATERALAGGYVDADQTLRLFDRAPPTTAEGALALADALQQARRGDEAQRLIRDWWRTRSFDADIQSRMLSRWGSTLTQDDHDARLSMLLLGPHGPATRAVVALASPERQAVANAAMSLRSAYSPDGVVANLSASQATDPAVVLERVRILRSQGRQSEGFALLRYLPAAPLSTDAQDTLWAERRNYFLDALQRGDNQAVYDAFNGHGFPSGERKVDAEFFAGWAALTKLNDPARAAQHFETLRQSSQTPITQGRALYWLGRAAEAQGSTPQAVEYYRSGAQHIQTFYGQLAAEKTGMRQIVLPADPRPSAEDRRAFEGDDRVRALRILGETNETSLFDVFARHIDDDLPGPEQLALLMDASTGYGRTFTAMMVGRAASQRGFLMPERQYPVRIPPSVPGAAPLEFTQAITRQESSFDPMARSHANARGMMQFVPATGRGVARQLGMPYSDDRLYDPDYNMTLGSFHLGDLMSNFGGSMLLTTIAYNAGPARPPQWTARCGDPRAGTVDPINFIECAPFTETRNYMMRVMENMQIYRARLNGGTGELRLSEDLRQGRPAGPQSYQPYSSVTDPGE